jgi:hypothetical protein
MFKGSVRRGETVTFHTRGGEVDGEISEAVGEAAFKTGERVLVFIESVDGRLYNLALSAAAPAPDQSTAPRPIPSSQPTAS